MAAFMDARLPLRFGPLASVQPDEAVLLPEGDKASPPAGHAVQRFAQPIGGGGMVHSAACPCCMPRGPLATALTRLFFARARGEVPFFAGVLVADADAGTEAAIRALLRRDKVIGSRYRAAPSAAGV